MVGTTATNCDRLICFTASSSWVPEREGSSGTAELWCRERCESDTDGSRTYLLAASREQEVEVCLPGQKLLECWCVKEMGRERVVKREGVERGSMMDVRAAKKKQSSARLFSPRFFANIGI